MLIPSVVGCSGGKAVGQLVQSDSGLLLMKGISSQAAADSTIRIYYTNPDSTPRYAVVLVNANAAQTIAFLPSCDSNTPAVSVLHTSLKEGSDNAIQIYAASSSQDSTRSGQIVAAPDIDVLKVPVR